MIIQDVVMGFTDISTNSEGGFSSIYAEDKVGRCRPVLKKPHHFMRASAHRDGQDMLATRAHPSSCHAIDVPAHLSHPIGICLSPWGCAGHLGPAAALYGLRA